MKIKVFNEEAMKHFETSLSHILISVRSPNTPKPEFKSQNNCLKRLYLQFHDIDPRQVRDQKECAICDGSGYLYRFTQVNNDKCHACNADGINFVFFTEIQARKILKFVEHYQLDVDLVCINCEAGISRSAGIAGALAHIYLGKEAEQYFFDAYYPNRHVYSTILKAYYKEFFQ